MLFGKYSLILCVCTTSQSANGNRIRFRIFLVFDIAAGSNRSEAMIGIPVPKRERIVKQYTPSVKGITTSGFCFLRYFRSQKTSVRRFFVCCIASVTFTRESV